MSLEEEQICAVQDGKTEQAMRRLRRVYETKKHEIPKIRELQRLLLLVHDQDVVCSVPRKSLLQIHDGLSQYARAVCLPDRWARIILRCWFVPAQHTKCPQSFGFGRSEGNPQ